MSILNFSKRKNNKKPIEVFYAWGDPKPTFEWGYIIAQEMFAKRGFRVFKTCANKGNFMKDYNGEECILLNGLIDQDLNGELFWWFINGNPIGDYDDISMDNVKVIIITARKMPLDWELHYELDAVHMHSNCEDIDHLYEVRKSGDSMASILEYDTTCGYSPSRVTVHEKVMLDELSMSQAKASNDYFEKLPIMEMIDGSDEEKSKFADELTHYTPFNKRKLCAILAAHDNPVPINRVKQIAKNLDDFYYVGYVQNYRDLGCYFIYDIKVLKTELPHALYFDFERFAEDLNYAEPGLEIPMDHVTDYGYVCGIDRLGRYPYFEYE